MWSGLRWELWDGVTKGDVHSLLSGFQIAFVAQRQNNSLGSGNQSLLFTSTLRFISAEYFRVQHDGHLTRRSYSYTDNETDGRDVDCPDFSLEQSKTLSQRSNWILQRVVNRQVTSEQLLKISSLSAVCGQNIQQNRETSCLHYSTRGPPGLFW